MMVGWLEGRYWDVLISPGDEMVEMRKEESRYGDVYYEKNGEGRDKGSLEVLAFTDEEIRVLEYIWGEGEGRN